jgi:hypothetical protein
MAEMASTWLRYSGIEASSSTSPDLLQHIQTRQQIRKDDDHFRCTFDDDCEIEADFEPLKSFVYDDVLDTSGRNECGRGAHEIVWRAGRGLYAESLQHKK